MLAALGVVLIAELEVVVLVWVVDATATKDCNSTETVDTIMLPNASVEEGPTTCMRLWRKVLEESSAVNSPEVKLALCKTKMFTEPAAEIATLEFLPYKSTTEL